MEAKGFTGGVVGVGVGVGVGVVGEGVGVVVEGGGVYKPKACNLLQQLQESTLPHDSFLPTTTKTVSPGLIPKDESN
jgi:hypothetical protein